MVYFFIVLMVIWFVLLLVLVDVAFTKRASPQCGTHSEHDWSPLSNAQWLLPESPTYSGYYTWDGDTCVPNWGMMLPNSPQPPTIGSVFGARPDMVCLRCGKVFLVEEENERRRQAFIDHAKLLTERRQKALAILEKRNVH